MENSLVIRNVDASALQAAQFNARIHSEAQLRQISNSIDEFGFNNPILIDSDNTIIAGHGRLDAAKALGLTEVPTICLEHLTPAQRRAFALADNRIAENAEWDQDLLSIELEAIKTIDIDFDLTITGFEAPKIDTLLTRTAFDQDLDEALPLLEDNPSPITKPGDLWQLGSHRIYCGDATKDTSYQRLLEQNQAQVIFTDPPYNVPIQGHVSGLGKTQHREFCMASGEMSPAEFTQFLSSTLKCLTDHSVDGSIHFICMDWRHLQEILAAGETCYSELKNLCVWNKHTWGMGSLYRSKHELVFVFKHGNAPHVNNVELGQHGRYRTNVWDYPGASALHEDGQSALQMHPTVKPVALIADALLDCSNRDDIVLDCFGGSGSTLLAAEHTQRKAHLIEIDPRYVDLAIERLKKAYGVTALHVETGLTFDALKDQRTAKEADHGR